MDNDIIEVSADEVIANLRGELGEVRYQNLLLKLQVEKLREMLTPTDKDA